ncbi:MAG: leucyl aminopeptidase family protein, partial [Micrococcales bacterium]|nr:leucyl aminopeptidase family protein [Micrococcales bacterium]
MAAFEPRHHALPAVTLSGAHLVDTPLLADGSVQAVAVPVAPARMGDDGLVPGVGTAEVVARYGIDLSELAERAGLTGAAGQAHVVHLPRPAGSGIRLPWSGLPPRIALVGVGDGGPAALRWAGAALARCVRGLGAVATTLGDDASADASTVATGTRAFVEGYLLAAYRTPSVAATDECEASAD